MPTTLSITATCRDNDHRRYCVATVRASFVLLRITTAADVRETKTIIKLIEAD